MKIFLYVLLMVFISSCASPQSSFPPPPAKSPCACDFEHVGQYRSNLFS